MTIRLITATIATAALMATASAAQAKDMTGKIGIGADTSLALGAALGGRGAGGVPRIVATPSASLVYQATPSFGLQALLTTNVNAGGNDGQLTESDVGIALRALIGTSLSKSASVAGVIGVSFLNRSYDPHMPGIDSESKGDIGIELGIRPEWFVTENLSFHTQVGVSIFILDDQIDLLDPMAMLGPSSVEINIGAADLLGNVGFTFYF